MLTALRSTLISRLLDGITHDGGCWCVLSLKDMAAHLLGSLHKKTENMKNMDFRVRWAGDAHPQNLFLFPREYTPHNLNYGLIFFPVRCIYSSNDLLFNNRILNWIYTLRDSWSTCRKHNSCVTPKTMHKTISHSNLTFNFT